MKIKQLAAMLAVVGIPAFAAPVVSVTSGPYTSVAGAVTHDFDGATAPGVVYTQAASNLRDASLSGVTAKPVGSTGSYLSVGTTDGTLVTIDIQLGFNANYFGFLAGSLDSYNSITFRLGGDEVASFTGTEIAALAGYDANGDQSRSSYWNLLLDAGHFYDRIDIFSSANAFETDNHAFGFVTGPTALQVPVPGTLSLMGAALLGFGAARRRRA